MDSNRAFLGCLALALTFTVPGCTPRLFDQREVSLQLGEVVSIPIGAVGHEQPIRVTASSPDAPINLQVFLAKDEPHVERMLTLEKPTDKLLAYKENSEQITLEAIVPANEEVIVRLQPAGRHSAQVHLELSN